ncbi:MAG: toll/interleukin-1 receptor domain-containing protein [Burkholderiaceae bacterium]
MPRATIFISYRRDDAAGYARAVGDRLARRYGAERVFVDVDDIAAGERFDDVIERALTAADLVLVLIGKRWRGELGADRPARIDEPHDRVRHEVASALAGPARVVPVLLDGTPMPDAASLPASLQGLVEWQAVELGNSRFEADLQRLLAAVDGALGEGGVAATRTVGRRALVAAGVGVGFAAGAGAWWWSRRELAPAAVASSPLLLPSNRPAINGGWQADVEYDWPNAHYAERFEFGGDAASLHGSASFLGVPRGVEQGRVDAGGVAFVIRTVESAGDARREVVHRYAGRLVGDDELRIVMQTEGASTPHLPVQFVARRAARRPPPTPP